MNKVQSIVALALALGIGYAAGYFTRDIRFPRIFLPKPPAYSSGQTPQKYRPPIAAAVEKARQLQAAGQLTEAQTLLRKQLRIYPQAEEAHAARELLGAINTELFFSDKSLFGKTEYVVARGDSLARIARKLNSTPEMIMRANSLNSTLIHSGDRLLIPDAEFTVTIDLPNERVVVHHGDGFFKQYPIQSIELPRSSQTRITTRVAATVFWKDGVRIRPGAPETETATPWVQLSRGGYVLYGISEERGVEADAVEVSEPEPEPNPDTASSPGPSPNPDIPLHGIALLRDDLEELQLFLRRGTPVTIIRERK